MPGTGLCEPLGPARGRSSAEESSTDAQSSQRGRPSAEESSTDAHSSHADVVGSDTDGVVSSDTDGVGKYVRKGREAQDQDQDSIAPRFKKDQDGNFALEPGSWKDEAWDIITVGCPMCASGVGRTLQMMGLHFILGNLDTQVLAAVACANIWTTVMETMLQSGMGQVVTLVSQAYGAENYRLVATWVHITFVYHTLVAIPFSFLRWFTTDVLLALGIEPEVAELAGTYTFYAQSVLVFELWYHTFRAYFAGQTIVVPDAIINLIFVFVWFGCAQIGVNVLDGGIVGAALAQATAWVLQFFVFVGVSFGLGYHKKTWYTPDYKEIFVWSRWKTLLAQLIPAGISGLLEHVQLQAMTLIAATQSEHLAASQTLASGLSFLCFMVAFGTSGGTGVRVGRFLGEGDAQGAKFTAFVGSAMVICCNCLLGLLAGAVLPYYARAASNDPLVWKEVDDAHWLIGFAIMSLGGFVVIANVIMKQGRPHLVGLSVAVCTWVTGIPISFFMAPTYGLLGIWTGMLCGYGMALVTLMYFFLTSDWEAIAQKARTRAEAMKQATQASQRRLS